MKQRLIFKLISLAVCFGIVCLAALPVLAETNKMAQRDEIEDKYKWNVEHIYPNIEAWQADYTLVEEALPQFEEFRGHLGDSPTVLLECLKWNDSIQLIVDNLYVYAYLKLDEDNRASEYQELTGRIGALYAKKQEATSFVEPEILAIGKDDLLSTLQTTPELDLYRFYLEDLIRQNEHVLSAEEEAILALAGPVAGAPRKIFTRLEDADLNFGSIYDEDSNLVELTTGRYGQFMQSTDRRVRKDSRNAFNQAYLNLQNTLAATLESSVRKDYFYSQARDYNSCLEMSLDANNIPTSVFHNLLEAVNNQIEVYQKWTTVQKRILGYDTLQTWDSYVPLVADVDRKFTYEEATEMMFEGLKPLGDKYLADLKLGLAPGAGWVDVYETEGKGGGAYSWGTYTSHPYILMNWVGTLDNVFTLAHEFGHAMHSYNVNKNEPYVYEGYSLFVAEVASTCNEAIMMKYMLENTTDKKEKMYLLNYYIQQISGTFYTQAMFSEFEIAIHDRIEKGEAVSAEYFRKTYRDIFQKYRGPDLFLGENEDIGGMRISHFYRQYYVYQYAVGYAAAQALSQKILAGDKDALEAYMTFLSTGASDYPVEILKRAGVDVTTPEPFIATINLFSELVDEMARLLDES